MFKVKYAGKTYKVKDGTTFGDFAAEHSKEEYPVILAQTTERLCELSTVINEDCTVELLDLSTRMGHDTYNRSINFLFIRSLLKALGDRNDVRIIQRFELANGFYYDIEGHKVTKPLIEKVRKIMDEYVESDIPIRKTKVRTDRARRIYKSQNLRDKDHLFRYRLVSQSNIYTIDGYADYFYGYLAWKTGVLKYYKPEKYKKGILLRVPSKSDPVTVKDKDFSEKMFKAQMDGELLAEQSEVTNIAELNDKVSFNNMSDPVILAEIFQDQKISRIADEISKRKGVKFVMIAGPSSSGKTTFSKKLCGHLRTYGLNPHYIGVDDYFKNREDTPLGPDGQKNYEDLVAIDVKQFNKDMADILKGKEVPMPSYDFKSGMRVYKGNTIKLRDRDILVIEGIHCLNDELSYTLPEESKYKICITALTQINIDDHNYFPASDGRLLRRLVRDNRTRGHSAKNTLEMWERVRKGEEKNIFPYQESADTIFNSALVYEIAALKPYAQPILFQILEDEPEFLEAKRLLKCLDYVIGIPSDIIPVDSLLREFIGGGCFNV